MESVRKFKANPKVAGQPCGWCQGQLMLGDDAAVCAACEKEHHAACWDSKAGCANPTCVNAPLKQLDPAVAAPQASPADALAAQGLMHCPNCRAVLTIGTQICLSCRAITTPDGIYHGPKTNAPGAVASLVMSIIGLFLCGIILGPLAISKANSAKSAIQMDPTLGGEGLATAGKVIGIIAIVFWAIAVVIRLGGVH